VTPDEAAGIHPFRVQVPDPATDVFLETERLVLRRFTDADLDRLAELDGDPEVMRIEVDEHGDVEYALTRAEWEELEAGKG
jgi:RimJ/RimL family protein N-acetyltransferase